MKTSLSDQFPEWQRKIKLLTDSAWQDAKLNEAKVDQWLENFNGRCKTVDVERRHAFHLFQQFIFFGKQEVHECLRVLFRDHFVYPTIQELRKTNCDPLKISAGLDQRLKDNVRFVGVGFPAESGQSFLYDFRIANDLPTELFPAIADITETSQSSSKPGGNGQLRKLFTQLLTPLFLLFGKKNMLSRPANVSFVPETLNHLIFFDDLCATGQQVEDRVGTLVSTLRSTHNDLRISYYLLFATEDGIKNVRKTGLFNDVEAAIVFDKDYKAFEPNSHCYKDAPGEITQTTGKALSHFYGSLIYPSNPLGYGNCQMLVAFEHNTPDNTLPIFWKVSESVPWWPIFQRTHKH